MVSKQIKINDGISEILIHTGQHYEKNMSDIFFSEMKLPVPDYNLNIHDENYGKMINRMVEKLFKILSKKNVDGVLVYGDTNSTLAGAITAKKINIPLFHIESGLRSKKRSMPEEINRLITDHLATLLFCPNSFSIQNLKNEKISNKILFSGDVMYDAYLTYKSKSMNKIIDIKTPFILSTIHRRENNYF